MVEAENDAILNRIYIHNLRPFGGKLLFECNILENDVCRYTQNRFLKDVLLAWCRCKANVAIPSYKHEILWNNSNIRQLTIQSCLRIGSTMESRFFQRHI